MKSQQGMYSVEFAIVGALFFILLFSVFEVGRLFFTWNVLTEASRRVARLAVVCDFDQDNHLVDNNAVLYALNDLTPLIPNFSDVNVTVNYLDKEGANSTGWSDIHLVRADIADYQHQFLVPFFNLTLTSPNFTSILPRESLGVTRWGYTACTGA